MSSIFDEIGLDDSELLLPPEEEEYIPGPQEEDEEETTISDALIAYEEAMDAEEWDDDSILGAFDNAADPFYGRELDFND